MEERHKCTKNCNIITIKEGDSNPVTVSPGDCVRVQSSKLSTPQPMEREKWRKWVNVLSNSTNPRDKELLVAKISVLLSHTREEAIREGQERAVEELRKMKKARCRCMCEKSNEAYRYNLVIDEAIAMLARTLPVTE